MYICMSTCMYIYVYKYIYIYVYIYVYIYIRYPLVCLMVTLLTPAQGGEV